MKTYYSIIGILLCITLGLAIYSVVTYKEPTCDFYKDTTARNLPVRCIKYFAN